MADPQRLAALRAAMTAARVDACIVPSADPHLSEYLPPRWQAREWLSGFTGSAGTLVALPATAGLWTDSRYFEQGERELAGSGIELMRQRVPHAPEHIAWLADHLAPRTTVAVAGDSISLAQQRALEAALGARDIRLRLDLDLPGSIWRDRPSLPEGPVYAHPAAFACATRADRLAEVRAAMRAAGATQHFLSALDDIAWLTLLRGADVSYNPVFCAHMRVGPTDATLFVPRGKIDGATGAALAADGIECADYAAAGAALAALPVGTRLLLDPARIAAALAAAIPASVERVERANPSTAAKARKSAAELAHWREAMRRDGAALVRGMREIEARLRRGERTTELDVDAILGGERGREADYVGPSFATIAGYGENGALPHYRATDDHHAVLAARGLLLVDSGGQYLGGTTDITRVWAFGTTSREEREDCTRVLQGLIALSRARFPAGASGPQLDALARAPLWAAATDYGHGTGHGVGYFLNVHEGPHGIRPPVAGGALVPLEPGMISSIEPGLYRPGRHGVRHENLAVVREAATSEFGRFLEFETLTLCPFDTRALEPALLDETERDWLNQYHARVLSELAPRVAGADRAWLEARCAPLAPPRPDSSRSAP